MKSKTQTNNEILASAKINDNEVSVINIRHVDSVHPVDCGCSLHRITKESDLVYSPPEELKNRENLDWYIPS